MNRMIFNRYTLPQGGSADDLYADAQVIQLDEIAGSPKPRSSRQLAALRAHRPNPAIEQSIFGTSLEWAFRGYIVHRLLASDEGNLPVGNRPSQPLTYAARQRQLASFQPVEREPNPDDQRLCLFNVLVATEWSPNSDFIDMLAWAFRRASDFLYDATDGRMAFGQVVVAGPELLDCADIQIMASNRLNPRTWVSGLHNELKYMAIRAGRGAWHKNNRVTIPWDEPEAYRTLVHEWSHYALELPDEYLEVHHVFLPANVDAAQAAASRLTAGTYTLVVPGISLATESIMGTLEGTSELVPQQGGSTTERKQNVWEIVREKGRYPFLDAVAEHPPLEGPGSLPLPLPTFHTLAAASTAPETLTLTVPNTIGDEHCWVYVIRGTPATPERVIAQGTLDARALADGFPLLGARPGDTVVLIGAAEGTLQVQTGTIQAVDQGRAVISAWKLATPPTAPNSAYPFPLVDIVPGPLSGELPDERIAQISVHVQSDTNAQPAAVAIFPHGQINPADVLHLGAPDSTNWTSAPQSVTSLDGHVLLRWADDSVLIYTYSQGGGPATHIPPGPPSISAGSSEGNIMLFFERDQQGRNYSAIRVVTTLVHGLSHTLPNGAQARSYAFSIASNEPLPVALHPTVVMYFDLNASKDGGDLLIHRQQEDGSWEAMPSYQPAGSSFIAMPLQLETGASLVTLQATPQRIERYRMYWVPRSSGSGSA